MQFTGRPLPPARSTAQQWATSFTTNYDEATVNESFIDGMAERNLNRCVFHFTTVSGWLSVVRF